MLLYNNSNLSINLKIFKIKEVKLFSEKFWNFKLKERVNLPKIMYNLLCNLSFSLNSNILCSSLTKNILYYAPRIGNWYFPLKGARNIVWSDTKYTMVDLVLNLDPYKRQLIDG